MRKLVSIVLLLGLVVGLGFAADDMSIGGKAYLSYSSNQNGTSAFQGTRAYLTVKRMLEDNTFVYTSDIDYTTTGQYNLYTKHLFVELPKFSFLGSVIRFGQIPTPWVDYANDIQGLNYIAKSLAERSTVLNSADRGISFTQAFDFGLNLDLAYINGNGYKTNEVATDLSRRDWAFKISYDDYDWHVAAATQLSGSRTSSTNVNTALAEYNFLVAYQSRIFTVGAEALTGTKNDLTISGFSLFANTEIASNYARIFARYDSYDLNTNVNDTAVNTLILVGIEKEIAKKVKGSINIQNTKDGSADADTTFYVNLEAKI